MNIGGVNYGTIKCFKCHGDGLFLAARCWACGGTGQLPANAIPCPYCKGMGTQMLAPCHECGGKGYMLNTTGGMARPVVVPIVPQPNIVYP